LYYHNAINIINLLIYIYIVAASHLLKGDVSPISAKQISGPFAK